MEHDDMKSMVAAGIVMAIEEFLEYNNWLLEETIGYEAMSISSSEVRNRMSDFSLHLQANFCDDIIFNMETRNDNKDNSLDSRSGSIGKSGERHDANSAEAGIVEEIAKGIKEIKDEANHGDGKWAWQ